MRTLSPSVDRIGAALKALRQTRTHGAQSEDKLTLGLKCLHAVTAQLAEEGLPKEDLKPLLELEARLRQISRHCTRDRLQPAQAASAERGFARPRLGLDRSSDQGRTREAEAAQIVMRRLVAAGIPAPQQGGDARGWKRLLEWRTDLMNGLVSEKAQQEYLAFTRKLKTIPAPERVQCVLDEKLWDRRRKPR